MRCVIVWFKEKLFHRSNKILFVDLNWKLPACMRKIQFTSTFLLIMQKKSYKADLLMCLEKKLHLFNCLDMIYSSDSNHITLDQFLQFVDPVSTSVRVR